MTRRARGTYDLRQRLWEIALDQYGHVTGLQAKAEGVSQPALQMMVRRGRLERVDFGLYRFPDFPASPLAPYMEMTLWPHETQGVLSHETALDLYDVCDVNPAVYHVTVPRNHRVRRAVPKQLRLHRRDLEPSEVTLYEGIPIVTLERAIRDAIEIHTSRHLIRQAIDNGETKGLLRRDVVEGLRRLTGLERN